MCVRDYGFRGNAAFRAGFVVKGSGTPSPLRTVANATTAGSYEDSQDAAPYTHTAHIKWAAEAGCGTLFRRDSGTHPWPSIWVRSGAIAAHPFSGTVSFFPLYESCLRLFSSATTRGSACTFVSRPELFDRNEGVGVNAYAAAVQRVTVHVARPLDYLSRARFWREVNVRKIERCDEQSFSSDKPCPRVPTRYYAEDCAHARKDGAYRCQTYRCQVRTWP